MVRDDHYGDMWLYPTSGADAKQAVLALLDWCAAFGIPKQVISGWPTYFQNESIRLLIKELKVRHRCTLSYCPWSNGVVERLGKELLQVAREMLSESQLSKNHLLDLLLVFQSVLNKTKSPHRHNKAPITMFSGWPATTAINTFIHANTAKPVSITAALRERSLSIETLQETMEQLHPMVQAHQHHRSCVRAIVSKASCQKFQPVSTS